MRFLYFTVLLLMFSCSKETDPLILFIEDLSNTWNAKAKDDFSSSPESTSIGEIDYEFAKLVHQKINNTDEGEKLVDYLKSRGVKENTGIARIVSISMHRELNNKNINLENQIEKVNISSEKLKSCKRLLSEKSNRDYVNYNIEDTIYIRLPLDKKNSNAVLYECPGLSIWIKSDGDNDDMVLKTILKKKVKSRSGKNKFLLKIIKFSKPDITILYEDINVGETIEIELNDGYLLSKEKF